LLRWERRLPRPTRCSPQRAVGGRLHEMVHFGNIMKRVSIILLANTLLLLLSANVQNRVSAQKLSAIPIDIEIPVAPTPVKANSKVNLLYELHLTNFGARSLEITRLEVLKDETDALPLASYKNAELVSRLAHPGAPSDLTDKRIIGGGLRAVVFLQISFDKDA